MIRTIAAAVAALAIVSFGVRADEPAKADAAKDDMKGMDMKGKGMDMKSKKGQKAHRKHKKASHTEAKPADAAPAK